MPMDDLYKALQMFKTGVNELATSRAIAGANEQVQQIKASEMDEAKQRQALNAVSQQLVSQMAMTGTPATTIQSVAAQFAPKSYGTADQMIAEGALLGDDRLLAAGQRAAGAAKADEFAYLKQQQDFQASQNALTRQSQERLAGTKASERAGKLRPLGEHEITRLTAQEDSFVIGDDLLARVKSNPDLVGVLAGRIPARGQMQSEFGAFQADLGRFFDKYRVATTGAGAGPKELEILMKRVASETDTPETFMAKMDSYLKEVDGNRSRYLGNLKKAKKDVAEYPDSLRGGEKSSGLTFTPVTVKDKKTGQMIQALRGSDGKLYSKD